MGRFFVVEIPDAEEKNIYTCANCEQQNDVFTHIALEDHRRYFTPGPPFWSYLDNFVFSQVINTIFFDEQEWQPLYCCWYIIKKVQCIRCGQVLGLYYITSFDPHFGYIEEKFSLFGDALNHWNRGIKVVEDYGGTSGSQYVEDYAEATGSNF